MALISWFFSDMRRVLFFAVLILIAALLWSFDARIKLKKDNDRVTDNFVQVQQDNQILNMKYSEREKYHNAKLDSVIKANKIRPKQVISATIIKTEYKDTIIEKIVYLSAQIQPDSSYKIQFSSDNGCVGVKGYISTMDEKSTIQITERTANNSVQALITRKRVLGFLWWKKDVKLEVFSDCGTANVTQINYE